MHFPTLFDSFTGQKMVEWNQLDVASFLEQATGFLAEHGQLDGPSCQAPPAKRARSVGLSSHTAPFSLTSSQQDSWNVNWRKKIIYCTDIKDICILSHIIYYTVYLLPLLISKDTRPCLCTNVLHGKVTARYKVFLFLLSWQIQLSGNVDTRHFISWQVLKQLICPDFMTFSSCIFIAGKFDRC